MNPAIENWRDLSAAYLNSVHKADLEFSSAILADSLPDFADAFPETQLLNRPPDGDYKVWDAKIPQWCFDHPYVGKQRILTCKDERDVDDLTPEGLETLLSRHMNGLVHELQRVSTDTYEGRHPGFAELGCYIETRAFMVTVFCWADCFWKLEADDVPHD